MTIGISKHQSQLSIHQKMRNNHLNTFEKYVVNKYSFHCVLPRPKLARLLTPSMRSPGTLSLFCFTFSPPLS